MSAKNDNYTGKEFGDPFERLVYWATHSGWRYCQGGKQCGNVAILKFDHFKSMVDSIMNDNQGIEPVIALDVAEVRNVVELLLDYRDSLKK